MPPLLSLTSSPRPGASHPKATQHWRLLPLAHEQAARTSSTRPAVGLKPSLAFSLVMRTATTCFCGSLWGVVSMSKLSAPCAANREA